MSSRIYLVRHGATEWSKNGKHTSTSDIPLTAAGEKEVLETRDAFVGPGKLMDPDKIARMWEQTTSKHGIMWPTNLNSYCSPRGRARRTAELLDLGIHEHQHFQLREGADGVTTTEKDDPRAKTIHVTPLIQEWDYGDYEGLTIDEVHKLRKQKGQHNGRNWSIWKDGCPGGEYVNITYPTHPSCFAIDTLWKWCNGKIVSFHINGSLSGHHSKSRIVWTSSLKRSNPLSPANLRSIRETLEYRIIPQLQRILSAWPMDISWLLLLFDGWISHWRTERDCWMSLVVWLF